MTGESVLVPEPGPGELLVEVRPDGGQLREQGHETGKPGADPGAGPRGLAPARRRNRHR